ncbi:MAG: selenocysteine synthase, partial [bacterium]|nr:selenocysteine synthase [bacterium]
IDAAADVPPVDNLFRFTKMGFDLVAFSGGKGIRGPQSAGLLLGRKELIEAALMNNSPNSNSLCRTNKVNKEEIVGMLAALELYLNRDHKAEWAEWERRCNHIANQVKKVKGVETEMFVPELANAVPHLRVMWGQQKVRVTPAQVHQRMREGKPSIELRPGAKEDIRVGVWMMQPGDDKLVAKRLRKELERG